MSDDAPAGHGHDSLIIKRGGGGHHDEHHGGVWKIAFADFMTAMMAFFLVMWLISANDKTKAVIAKYFNPIELVDSTPQPRGLSDPKKDDPNIEHKGDTKDEASPTKEQAGAKEPAHGSEGTHGKEEKEARKTEPAPPAAAPHPEDKQPLDDADHTPTHDEVELIRDPYAVIAEIAEKKSVEPPKSAAEKPAKPVEGGTGAVGINGGEAFRDPFEPQPVAAGRDPFAIPTTRPEAPPPAGFAAATEPPAEGGPNASPRAGTGAADTAHGPAGAVEKAEVVAPAAATPDGKAPPGGQEVAAKAEPGPSGKDAVGKPLAPAALRAEIVAAAKALDPAPAHAAVPAVEVRRTEEGLLVSLTDSADYTMFASGSARPSPRAVTLMGTIGKLLRAQKGAVVVRGFTDSRPFRSDVYDNWRLSTERAHIAQYMLVRGGLDEARIDRVEGYADRHPRNTRDLASAENRRIEILLRGATP